MHYKWRENVEIPGVSALSPRNRRGPTSIMYGTNY